MASWPATLPQEFPEDSISYTMPDNVQRSSVDVGPPKVRRRTTANTTKVTGDMLLTTAQLAIFNTFFVTTISYGATSFTWVNPLTNASCSMRFTEPPKYSPAGGDYVKIQMSLEILV